MIDLKVYADDGSQYFLDMYETSPLKINLSIEDLQAETTSAYSRAFRVPATNHNAEFFKTAFMVEGNDFDVTQKKAAEILVDGNGFRKGHIRLQKIFVNAVTGQTDYEILFLGETRDFAASIGDATMCELLIPSLTHTLNETNIVASWNAYPESATSGTAGLQNGNVLYPLIDFGNTYDENGCIQESRISTSHDHPAGCATSNDYFTFSSAKGLEPKRFKPMIRAKKLWDQIFENAGFTYTSDFIGQPGDNTDVGLFKQLYVSAFGNDEAITVDETLGSADNFQANGDPTYLGGSLEFAPFTIEISDPGNNYDPVTSTYTAPATGVYTFFSRIDALGQSGQGTSDRNTEYFTQYWKNTGSGFSVIPGTNSFCTAFGYIDNTKTFSLNAGDEVRVYVNDCASGDSPYEPIRFQCTASPAAGFNPVPFMDCEYKQIDFIKDVITSFRLVMQPNPNKDRDFIIEPWNNFRAGGEVLDWSDKLVNDKDMQIEPLFFTQTEEIDFNLTEDSDWVNTYHRQVWKNNYGYLEFDANNELLKGKREIKVNYAPTPITPVEGTPINSEWLIPHIHTHSAEDTGNQHLPIKAKTRFLFYNGKAPSGADRSTPTTWYFKDSNGYTVYPVVSPISGEGLVVPSINNLVLQWYNDVIYYVPTTNTQWEGQSMYDIYWSSYIQQLYASFARKVTAYFTLNYLDLYDFTFDKVIFVNGSYYSVNKIVDAPVGDRAIVKVELTKELLYAPPTDRDIAMVLEDQYAVLQDACNGGTPYQTVTYTGLLQVGTQLDNITVSGGGGFFLVQSNNVESQYVGQVLGVSSAGVVSSINNICP